MSFFDRLKWPLTSIAGMHVIILYCLFMFSSAAFFRNPWTPWPYLSDFGNTVYNPSGAVLYNLGCILTGLMLFPFYIGLYKWYSKESWRKVLIIITQLIGLASGFALIMIGVFNENYGTPHETWSTVFFMLNLGVLILANISLFTHPKFLKFIAIYGFIVAVINLALVVLPSSSIIEWFTVFTALVYAGLLSINTVKAFPIGKK
jgi:hypothetical membrane protein